MSPDERDFNRARVCALWEAGHSQSRIAVILDIGYREVGRHITWARHRGYINPRREDISEAKQGEVWELHLAGRTYGQIELETGICKPRVKHIINRRYHQNGSGDIAKQDRIGAVS